MNFILLVAFIGFIAGFIIGYGISYTVKAPRIIVPDEQTLKKIVCDVVEEKEALAPRDNEDRVRKLLVLSQ